MTWVTITTRNPSTSTEYAAQQCAYDIDRRERGCLQLKHKTRAESRFPSHHIAYLCVHSFANWPNRSRCHGLSVYPVCVCNTVRLGQDTTWNRRVHGLSVYPVWVCDKIRLGQDTTWNRREHRLSVSPNWVCTMLGGYKRWTFSDGFGDKPSHSIRCVYRADLILCRYMTDHLRKYVLQY